MSLKTPGNSPSVKAPWVIQLGEENEDTDKIIKACDTALEACKRANSDKQLVVNQQERIIVEQQGQIEQLKEDQNSIWRSPIFSGVIGAILIVVILIVTGHTK